VELVDEQDHLRVRPHLFDHPGQALLELAPVLRPRHHLRHRQLDQPPSREEPTVPPEGDPLRERLDDGGLPDPRLPHEDGVVLGGHHEDLDELPKGVAGPVGVDKRQEAPFPRGPGDIAAVPVQERRLGGKRLRGNGQISGLLADGDRFLLQLPSPEQLLAENARGNPRARKHRGDDRTRVLENGGKKVAHGNLPPVLHDLPRPAEVPLALLATVDHPLRMDRVPWPQARPHPAAHRRIGDPEGRENPFDPVRLLPKDIDRERLDVGVVQVLQDFPEAAQADQEVLPLDERVPKPCRLGRADLPRHSRGFGQRRHGRSPSAPPFRPGIR
jgi:Protein of unknown function (DUF3170).